MIKILRLHLKFKVDIQETSLIVFCNYYYVSEKLRKTIIPIWFYIILII